MYKPLMPHCLGDQIEKNYVGRSCSTYAESRGVYRVLVGKPEGERPLGRPRYRWENNIKLNLSKVRCDGMDWIDVAQLAGTCECGNKPWGSIKCGDFLTSWETY
jgi:hypothetical protein